MICQSRAESYALVLDGRAISDRTLHWRRRTRGWGGESGSGLQIAKKPGAVGKVAWKYENEINLELFGSRKETIYDFHRRLHLKSMTTIASLSQTSYAIKLRHGLYSSY